MNAFALAEIRLELIKAGHPDWTIRFDSPFMPPPMPGTQAYRMIYILTPDDKVVSNCAMLTNTRTGETYWQDLANHSNPYATPAKAIAEGLELRRQFKATQPEWTHP